jgi:hypothetical protein
MGWPLASLARLFHLAAIRPDKSRGPRGDPPGHPQPNAAAIAASTRRIERPDHLGGGALNHGTLIPWQFTFGPWMLATSQPSWLTDPVTVAVRP